MAKKDPSFNWKTERGAMKNYYRQVMNPQQFETMYPGKSKRRSAARKAGGPRMSLAQLERAGSRAYPMGAPSMVEGSMMGHQAEQLAMRQEMGMGKKLMKSGGGIRLPQLGKGGMGGMMAMMMMMLAMGMMGGNDDSSLDEVIGG